MSEPDSIAASVGNVWEGVLQQVTAAGGTREEIIMATAEVAETILMRTGAALWKDGVPPGEAMAVETFAFVQGNLSAFRSSRTPIDGHDTIGDLPEST